MAEGAYLAGPLIALVTIAALAIVLYRTLDEPVRATVQSSAKDDYGLLVTIAVVNTLADATLLRDHLRIAGVRATLATTPEGRMRVLVFGDEVHKARRVVG